MRMSRKEKIRDGGRLLLLATTLPGKLQLWSHGHWLYSGFLTCAVDHDPHNDEVDNRDNRSIAN